jgi:hypothetical protein
LCGKTHDPESFNELLCCSKVVGSSWSLRHDLNKLKLSDPNSVGKLKQDLNAQIQSAVKAPVAPTAGSTPTTSTSSGVPAGSTATTSAAAIAPTTGTSTPPAGSSAASPTTGTPATTTATPAAATTATPSPTTPTSLTNPESIKAADAKLKDLGNQEKILKGLMVSDKKNTAQYTAQLKGLDSAKQAAIKEKQAAQAALKKTTSAANISAYKNKQQAAGMNLNANPNLTNASYKPAGSVFNELFNKLEGGLKLSKKFNLLS